MLTQEEIDRMFAEMGLQDETDRARFIEWSKVTLHPPQTEPPFFYRLSTTPTPREEEQQYGKLERNTG